MDTTETHITMSKAKKKNLHYQCVFHFSFSLIVFFTFKYLFDILD